jgi:hypothetical protein
LACHLLAPLRSARVADDVILPYAAQTAQCSSTVGVPFGITAFIATDNNAFPDTPHRAAGPWPTGRWCSVASTDAVSDDEVLPNSAE